MLVKTLLAEKSGSSVACISPDAGIGAAAALMTARRIGALLVIDDQGALAGIISERDLVRGMAEAGKAVLDKPVSALMSRVLVVDLEDSVDHLMAKMTERRIRHFPVMDRGRLAGIVSIGDIVKHKIAEAEGEARALRDYITR